MNFALIPFFLAANISVDNPKEWIHGPEYVFQTNITVHLFPDLVKESYRRVSTIMYMNCRPQSPERLLCLLREGGIESSNEDVSSEEFKSKLDMPFLIEFGPRGVENLRFVFVMDKLDLYFIRSIVKQLSIGADLNENENHLFGFEARENYIFGECTTFFKVSEHDRNKNHLTKNLKEERNYDLELLALNPSRPNSVFVIEKRTENKRCVKPRDPDYRSGDADVESISQMRVSNDMFKSRTELHVKKGKTSAKKNLVHQDIISLELVRIEAAKEPLPSLNFDHVVPLHFKGTIDHNIVS